MSDHTENPYESPRTAATPAQRHSFVYRVFALFVTFVASVIAFSLTCFPVGLGATSAIEAMPRRSETPNYGLAIFAGVIAGIVVALLVALRIYAALVPPVQAPPSDPPADAPSP